MWKNLLLSGLLAALVGYFLADKPLMRVSESNTESNKRNKLVVAVTIGVANNVNVND